MKKLHLRPKTILALVIALAAGGLAIYNSRHAGHHVPVEENIVHGTSPNGIAPTLEFLLRHQTDLALSKDQVKQISALAAQYRRDIGPTQKQLNAAADKFQNYLERQAHAQRPDTQQQVNANGAEMQRLSGIVSTTRHIYLRHAETLLTPEQQQHLDKLIATVKPGDLK